MDKKNLNEKNVKEQINSFLPDRASDDPNTILKTDKKLYTIIFIVLVSLSILSSLISIIIGFCTSVIAGCTALFVGTINTTIVLLLVTLLITVAHNISRTTRATMFICNKLMKDEKRAVLKEKQEKIEEKSTEDEVEIEE